MESRDTGIDQDPPTGRVGSRREVVTGPGAGPLAPETETVSTFNPGWRAVQLVYLVFGMICGLLLIRLVLKLLGANPHAPFAGWTYGVSDFFLAPFHNVLPAIGNRQSLLEMSVVVAILVYALIGFAVGKLVAIIFYRNVMVRRGSLRPRGY